MFTFTQGGLFSVTTAVNFVDFDGIVHNFSTSYSTNEEREEIINSIWGVIDEKKLVDIDGLIKVDEKTGDVYEIFQTDAPEEPERVIAQMQFWEIAAGAAINSASEATENKPFIQMLLTSHQGEETLVADLTQGRRHLVTNLDSKSGYDEEYLKTNFAGVEIQDNTPVLQWADTLKLR